MNAPNTRPGRSKPNLTSVTPAAPPPPPAEIDSHTPHDQPIVRFNMSDLPKWGPWMLYRLSEHWPQFTSMSYGSLLSQVINDNGCLIIRAKKAILMARLNREDFSPRPVVDIVFCFKFHPDDDQEDKDVRLLFRRVEEWAAALGVQFVRVIHPEHIDGSMSKIKGMLYGEEAKFLLKDLDK